MNRKTSVIAAPLLLRAGHVTAQGPAIDHAGVGCMVAERFAGLDARFTPADDVGRARAYFRAGGTQDRSASFC